MTDVATLEKLVLPTLSAGVDSPGVCAVPGRETAAPARTCPLCGEGEVQAIFAGALEWVRSCRGCGLVFADPQPSDDELAAIYDRAYYRTFGYEESRPAAYRLMKQAGHRRVLDLVEQNVSPGRLLDVGSALGDLLHAARLRDWDAVGIEPNPFAVLEANRIVPGVTCQGTLDGLPAEQGPFDAITCLDVLEHLRDPDDALRRMQDLLRPGGTLLVTTVDAGGWQARAFGSRWVHLHRDHLWYFDRRTLARFATEAGFEVLACRPAGKVFNSRYIFEILAGQTNFPSLAWCARRALGMLPSRFLNWNLPPLREGLLLIARRPVVSQSEIFSVGE